jgi:hypothetical protein
MIDSLLLEGFDLAFADSHPYGRSANDALAMAAGATVPPAGGFLLGYCCFFFGEAVGGLVVGSVVGCFFFIVYFFIGLVCYFFDGG